MGRGESVRVCKTINAGWSFDAFSKGSAVLLPRVEREGVELAEILGQEAPTWRVLIGRTARAAAMPLQLLKVRPERRRCCRSFGTLT